MKTMKILTIGLTAMIGLQSACASLMRSSGAKFNRDAVQATYFRVWSGFKKPTMNQATFMDSLPSFMNETVELYQNKGLSNYIVAIPPQSKPDFIPDEFALVAMKDEKSYRDVRATPEGQKYSERHWEVFDNETSKSAPKFYRMSEVQHESLESGSSYDMVEKSIDWSQGYNLVYVGTRKEGTTKSDYLKKLASHVKLAAKNLNAVGLQGYIVLANENYEVAYLNWSSKAAHDKAFTEKLGQEVGIDGAEFMDTLMYLPTEKFEKQTQVNFSKSYSSINEDSK